ncbi:hypothetical protein FLA_3077 [Filimonas lacunae]|nr:hypothetical protein FLA_3077 [Filimonas lacunae]
MLYRFYSKESCWARGGCGNGILYKMTFSHFGKASREVKALCWLLC